MVSLFQYHHDPDIARYILARYDDNLRPKEVHNSDGMDCVRQANNCLPSGKIVINCAISCRERIENEKIFFNFLK